MLRAAPSSLSAAIEKNDSAFPNAVLRLKIPLIAIALLFSTSAKSHSFGEVYTLPMPFHLYAWGSAATLLLSFLLVALMARSRQSAANIEKPTFNRQLPDSLLFLLRCGSVFSLGLCIATGLYGIVSPYDNYNMTWFWILFVLGYAYLTALIGDVFTLINPWRLLTNLIGAVIPCYSRGLLRYPSWLGYWPAFLLYGAFIWLELFTKTTPALLAWQLIGYTGFNVLMAGFFGVQSWFRYGEFFSVVLRLIATMAPVGFAHEYSGSPSRHFHWRIPFSGLLRPSPARGSLLMMILFMLAATAFDGLHESKAWAALYWQWLYPEFLASYVGSNFIFAYAQLREWNQWWQRGWLMLAPFVYLLVYLLGMKLMALLVGAKTWPLAKRFAYSLMPIVLVYHITHYYTLIQSHGVKIIALVSDPFGYGWDLFGTAGWFKYNIVPDVKTVWHVQVGLIVLGHVISVYVAHLEALRAFNSRRTATISQLPIMVLMVAFTIFGLWILSQPMQAGR